MPASEWDAQYAAGEWDYLRRIEQAPRYAVLAAWSQALGRPLRVMDVGCGEGNLLSYVHPGVLSSYLGVDFSREALEKAVLRWPERSDRRFQERDANLLVADDFAGQDVVIFNEVLYCLEQPVRLVDAALAAGRVVLFSVIELHARAAHEVLAAFPDRVLEACQCVDARRRKAWNLAFLRSD
jgi:2-polyprenyl-3-methyl-5-hydroxy-6-metoxy-1,4-benzoquinol methylase